jgi:hypothetical protein
MKKLETVIHIHAPLHHVWNVLMDFDRYPEWNPFVKMISGKAVEGEQISVSIKLPGKKAMMFKPVVLKSVNESEFRWKGKFIVKGIFDGEHYFLLSELPNGSTALQHGEIFTGILIPFMGGVLKSTKSGFENMNVALKERCEMNESAPE